MNNIINIHIGQAGVQMGESLWKTYHQQFSLNQEGKPREHSLINHRYKRCQLTHQTLFRESQSGSYIPRALFYDGDPIPIDQIKKSLKNLSPGQTHHGKQNDSTYFCAMYRNSRRIKQQVMDMLRKEIEKCDCLEGLILHAGIGGGTGSGVTSLISEIASVNYTKIPKFHFAIFPSRHYSNSIIQPYNTIFSLHSLTQHSDITFPINNQQLYHIYEHKLDIESPKFSDINKTISQICSNITLPMCQIKSGERINFTELITNLVPYPRLHFVAPSYSPFLPLDAQYTEKKTLQQITNSAFQKESYIVEMNPAYGKYMANYLLYRGNVSHQEAIKCSQQVKRQNYMQVDWVSTGMKISVFNHPRNAPLPHINDQELCLLSNSKSIECLFSSIDHRFDLLYAHRAFVHHYTLDASQGEFSEAREDVAALELDFSGGGIETAEGEEGQEESEDPY